MSVVRDVGVVGGVLGVEVGLLALGSLPPPAASPPQAGTPQSPVVSSEQKEIMYM